MNIYSNFDSGNIEVLDSSDLNHIQLKIRKDTKSDFFQWFHFQVSSQAHHPHSFHIVNAHESSYVQGWQNYQAVASYDRENWFRVKTEFNGKELIIKHTPEFDNVYFAYFAPYTYERHLSLLQQVQMSPIVEMLDAGSSVEGRSMAVAKMGSGDCKVWIIGRQHPGETMAEWFIEGLLDKLLDDEDPVSSELLSLCTFWIVPNMNPDGSFHGNLRSNAAGANLNREWAEPSLEKSPEVLRVRNLMQKEGCDIFLDVHGDEAIPYNFVAASEGVPSYNEEMAELEKRFKNSLLEISPDFQIERGYPKDEPGKANLTIASSWVAENFKCLSLTIEMPFKDNDNLPNPVLGWSAGRSACFGRDVLRCVHKVVKNN